MSNTSVSEIQSYLNGIAHYNSKIPKIIPDGIYGKESEIAVRAFQHEYSIPVTGLINKVTWDKIVTVYKMLVLPEAEKIRAFESKNSVMKQGDKGYNVTLLQIMLNTILASCGSEPEKSDTSGFYDNATVRRVKKFQILSLEKPDGIVDVNTWNLIVRVFDYMCG